MTAGRIVLIVLGSFALIFGLAFAAGGGVVLVAQSAFRDAEGFFVSGPHPFESSGYAITSNRIDLGANPERGATNISGIFTLRLRAQGSNGKQIFIGVAPSDEADAYLANVDHDVVTDVSRPFRATYEHVDGGPPSRPPGQEPIWVATGAGQQEQQLLWHPRSGRWTVVIMNADGSGGVGAQMSVGVRVRYLAWIGIGLLGLALLAFIAGGLMLYFGVRQPRQKSPALPAEVAAS
ncbi:MAG TPA: hypothetical protein VKV69_04750 [Actinomycetota bacterium]|nr:hypothetical protein [Actinomycetota bacterium]